MDTDGEAHNSSLIDITLEVHKDQIFWIVSVCYRFGGPFSSEGIGLSILTNDSSVLSNSSSFTNFSIWLSYLIMTNEFSSNLVSGYCHSGIKLIGIIGFIAKFKGSSRFKSWLDIF